MATATARRRQPIPTLDAAARFLTVLDALAACPDIFSAHHELFDEDGSLVAVLTTWATSTNREIVVEADSDGRPVHRVEIRKRLHVSVHDWTSTVAPTEAIRAALRAPHWTDDTTLTDEERAEREQMEAGHA